MPEEDVTLGEVGRGVDEVKADVRQIRSDMSGLQVAMAGLSTRVGILDRIVYGTVGVALSALVAAVVGLVIKK